MTKEKTEERCGSRDTTGEAQRERESDSTEPSLFVLARKAEKEVARLEQIPHEERVSK